MAASARKDSNAASVLSYSNSNVSTYSSATIVPGNKIESIEMTHRASDPHVVDNDYGDSAEKEIRSAHLRESVVKVGYNSYSHSFIYQEINY